MSTNLTTEPSALLGNHIEIKQLTGVGDVELDFVPNKQVYCLIGENGIGKTKYLEALFASYIGVHQHFLMETDFFIWEHNDLFKKIIFDENVLTIFEDDFTLNDYENIEIEEFYNKKIQSIITSEFPVVLASILSRGIIKLNEHVDSKIGSKYERLHNHVLRIENWFYRKPNGDDSLDIDTKEWIIQRAQSANRFQKKEDNREAEISTLLKLLNEIDSQFDANFLEITGEDEVYIKVNGQKTELSELSSGFSSLLKIIQ